MNKSTAYDGQYILSQILSVCPQKELAAIIHKAKSDYKSKRVIKAREHFVTILFSVLSGCSPILETCMGLKPYQSKLNHANIKNAGKETLSDINKERSTAVSRTIFSHLNSLYCNAISDST